MAGWLILRDLLSTVSFASALLVVPLAAAMAFLPITVGGAGAREAVFITLCASLFGMSSNVALAASLMLWFSVLVVAGFGGVLQLTTRPMAIQERSEEPPVEGSQDVVVR